MKEQITKYFEDFTIWKKMQIGYFVSVIAILVCAFLFHSFNEFAETYLIFYMIPAFAGAILVVGTIVFMAFCFVGHFCISIITGKNPFEDWV